MIRGAPDTLPETDPMRLTPLAAILAIALALTACGPTTPLWSPQSFRNGAGEPVDPVYGTPVPGYPLRTM
jgi:predicted small lipoprotein YifL